MTQVHWITFMLKWNETKVKRRSGLKTKGTHTQRASLSTMWKVQFERRHGIKNKNETNRRHYIPATNFSLFLEIDFVAFGQIFDSETKKKKNFKIIPNHPIYIVILLILPVIYQTDSVYPLLKNIFFDSFFSTFKHALDFDCANFEVFTKFFPWVTW